MVASASNDHRLGANEAPPAIISIFLGEQLADVFNQLKKGKAKSSKAAGTMHLGVDTLPLLMKDAGDRNRTSPFAFTGNKFEFRAVGSSQNVAWPNTVLNTIVAESLDFIATELEKGVKSGKEFNAAIQELLPGIVKEGRKVLFNGDGYSEDWHKEAEKRGLPNLKSTTDVLPVAVRKDTLELFAKYKVFTEKELQSRFNILSEAYVKTVDIEAKTALLMAQQHILPAALKHQKAVAESIAAVKAAGVDPGAQLDLLKSVSSLISDLQKGIVALTKALEHHADGTPYDHAKAAKVKIIPLFAALRSAGDALESIVADEFWTLPTYREMLFLK